MTDSQKILVGIDAGATNCRVAICDVNGYRIAEARGGPANIANDYEDAKANILKTTADALYKVGLEKSAFENVHAVLGVAGSNLGDFGLRLHNDLPFAKNEVHNDVRISIAGALGENYGVLAALGTGSVFARQDENGFQMGGGWGFLMGDEGSGAKLGYHLLARTIYAEDQLFEHTAITREVMSEFNGSIGHLVEAAKAMPPHEFGGYAPRVIDAAHKGDANAIAIMNDATVWIERQIDAIGFREDRPLCLLGGLGPIFLPKLGKKYQSAFVEPKGNALDGACLLAIKNWK